MPFSENGLAGSGYPSDVAVLGAGIDSGAGDRPGARHGPSAIRSAPYDSGGPIVPAAGKASSGQISVVDTGDCAVVPAEHDASIDELRRRARAIVPNTRCLVTLGGDNSVILPAMEALAERHGRLTLLHFDAHTDTWGEGASLLTHATVVRRAVEGGLVRRGHQIGIRGYGPFGETLRWGEEHGLTCWTMEDLDALGLGEALLGIVADVAGPVHLSVDIDVLDPAYAPGTGTPEPGGLTSRQLLRAISFLARRLDVVGFDVVETSPPHDRAGITAIVAQRCVMELIAAKAATAG
ncbi:arginase family protein [Spirillospora sp. NPDC050679]